MARQRIPDRRDKVHSQTGLRDISQSTFGEASADKLNACLHRQEHTLGGRTEAAQFTCCFDPGEFRHRDIQDNYVWLKSGRFEQQLFTVGHSTYNLEVGLQQRADPFSDGTMVIGKQYTRPIHFSLLIARLASVLS